MLGLRRFLLASLLVLTGFVVACQPKPRGGGSGDATPADSLSRKIKKMQEAPEGPSLRR
jgi:hypothetical protein